MQTDQEVLRETLRLTQENNKMLHAMRRHALIGGIVRVLVYAAIVLVPFWLYMQYLAPKVDKMMQVMTQVQGTSQEAKNQITEWQTAFQDLRAKIPGMSSTSAN